jgi:chromosome partitioning protein
VINIAGADSLHKIVVLNPKGGCGKTTLATNLASAYAQNDISPTLVDLDPQGYCIRWLERRPAELPEVYGIQVDAADLPEVYGIKVDAADKLEDPVPEIPRDANLVIMDLPAAIPHARLQAYTYVADTVLLPIVPSEIDVYSATRFIAELLLDVQLDRREQKLAIVANRVKARTRSYRMLLQFLSSLKIPMIATLRDSQNFVHASARGLGVCELPQYRAKDDIDQIRAITRWVDKRRAVTRDRQALIAQAAYQRTQKRGSESGESLSAQMDMESTLEH